MCFTFKWQFDRQKKPEKLIICYTVSQQMIYLVHPRIPRFWWGTSFGISISIVDQYYIWLFQSITRQPILYVAYMVMLLGFEVRSHNLSFLANWSLQSCDRRRGNYVLDPLLSETGEYESKIRKRIFLLKESSHLWITGLLIERVRAWLSCENLSS